MAGQLLEAFPPALVIGGMHRSGTSLTASLIAAAGVHIGDDLMPAAAGNPRGHFEDLEFYNLHQRILAACGLSMEGFTCQERIDVPDSSRADAADLVRRRRAAGRTWGWKDPRTVLFLDFWAELVPEARWLFVVRPPEEVVDSLFRRGDTAFAVNPRHAVDVWAAYSRRIIDFVRRHAERSAVVTLGQVVADPAGLVATAADLLGTALATPGQRYESQLLKTSQPAHRAALVRAVQPEAADLHGSLLRLANAGGDVASARGLPPAAAAEAGLAEWAAGCRALTQQNREAVAGYERDLTDALERLATAERTRDQLEVAVAEAVALADRHRQEVDTLRGEQADLVAQLEAERAIHERLRQDMNGRLEAAAARHGR